MARPGHVEHLGHRCSGNQTLAPSGIVRCNKCDNPNVISFMSGQRATRGGRTVQGTGGLLSRGGNYHIEEEILNRLAADRLFAKLVYGVMRLFCKGFPLYMGTRPSSLRCHPVWLCPLPELPMSCSLISSWPAHRPGQLEERTHRRGRCGRDRGDCHPPQKRQQACQAHARHRQQEELPEERRFHRQGRVQLPTGPQGELSLGSGVCFI